MCEHGHVFSIQMKSFLDDPNNSDESLHPGKGAAFLARYVCYFLYYNCEEKLL